MYKIVLNFALLLSCTFTFSQSQSKVSGVVFVDGNKNSIQDKGEQALPNVLISNGKDFVKTDKEGRYSIKKVDGNTVFLIKPADYISPVNKQNSVLFYVPFDQVKQVDTYNFPLIPHQEKKDLKIALLGDTQVDVMDDVYHVGKLVTEELIDKDLDFIVPLGDLSFDNLNIFKPLSETLGLIGAPVFYTIGNHDLNFKQTAFMDRDKSFERIFGPSYYAFEYGKQLFLVLNNIYPINEKDYKGRLDEMQLEFVKHLIELEKDNFDSINIFMHIPLEEMEDRDEIITILKPFKNVFIGAGHTHTQYHKYFEREKQPPVHELVAGAVCGAWWQGPHDIDQIPFSLMYDGTPKGYWFLRMNENTYKLDYKVSGAAENKQMDITLPQENEWDTTLNFLNDNFIYANVFAADESTKVSISFDGGEWIDMIKFEGISPRLQKLYFLQSLGRFDSLNISRISKPETISNHLWRIMKPIGLLPGAHSVKIKAISKKLNFEAFGNTVLWVK
ncbi:calcineurin-like phosphoesterase C-terminal domain-containing protein [Flavobacterium granuli]|uniref:3',5'-cyclic AMP phosphodiesterase CpdA n=1 Tax=Flavobacterium granuli TaxID=280093 RepID=A0A1M5J5Z9_9FLAO|nr:calcineurin-like phosphoesterase family protein [Flavobacterium granuli]PRZ28242.1 3',5'-cyclic AMP phosphodiesterase CpdA [Flavobacterium granuli]SHG35709.1 3',5'-cyclic AMP phosphodiesterase CpdA [Flavobacterium granuli]